jgi:hypothetical protein
MERFLASSLLKKSKVRTALREEGPLGFISVIIDPSLCSPGGGKMNLEVPTTVAEKSSERRPQVINEMEGTRPLWEKLRQGPRGYNCLLSSPIRFA